MVQMPFTSGSPPLPSFRSPPPTPYLGIAPIHMASSVRSSLFPSLLSTGEDLALGDKFLFDECTLWECFILTDYFYLFNVHI